MAILGVDVGGTFTDAVLLDAGELRTAKVPTAERQEESVVEAARAVGADAVDGFGHGTTIATNALLERKGARTAFVATAGFEHLLHLRRQDRAHLYRPCARHAEPLVPLERCHGVRERIGPDGVLVPLELDSLEELDAEAVAICCLFSFRDPTHERLIAAEVRRRLPEAHVVASHEIAPEFREYERASTAAADAYLGPVVSRYARSLRAACADAGLPEPLVMRSSGGVASIAEVAAHPAIALVSGPAAGVAGAARVARAEGIESAISFDMGGTSTDVCVIVGGSAERTSEREVAGLPIRLPTIDLHTVGAGGGSIVWRDVGGALRVGPESAGAYPGPPATGAAGRGRRSRTRISCSVASRAGSRAGSSSTPRRRRLHCGASSRPRPSRSSTRRCCAPCASSPSSAATTRATSRWWPSAAAARRTAPATPPSWGCAACSCRRLPPCSARWGSGRRTCATSTRARPSWSCRARAAWIRRGWRR